MLDVLRFLCMADDITNQTILDYLQHYMSTKSEDERLATKDDLRAAKDEILREVARVEELTKSLERQITDVKYKTDRLS